MTAAPRHITSFTELKLGLPAQERDCHIFAKRKRIAMRWEKPPVILKTFIVPIWLSSDCGKKSHRSWRFSIAIPELVGREEETIDGRPSVLPF